MAITQNLLPFPELQFFDNNGNTLADGHVYTYDADGLTPKGTWQDSAGTIANTNPIQLDGAGRALIYGTGQYVWKVEDRDGNILYTQPTAEPTAWLGISAAMLPVIQAETTAAALALLGGAPVGSFIPVGLGPLPWGGGSAPAGWVLCAGQELSRTTYSALFAVIGTTYGAGNGSSTFNAPDCRGRVNAGADSMSPSGAANRLTSASLGATATPGAAGGNENVQEHNHALTDPGHVHSFNADHPGPITGQAAGQNGDGYGAQDTASATTGITIDNYGTGASLNVQPTLVSNMIIFAGV